MGFVFILSSIVVSFGPCEISVLGHGLGHSRCYHAFDQHVSRLLTMDQEVAQGEFDDPDQLTVCDRRQKTPVGPVKSSRQVLPTLHAQSQLSL